jgi:hypothetical protein
LRIGKKDEEVTVYSQLTGKPFKVVLRNYPFGEIPRVPVEELKAARLDAKMAAFLAAEASRCSRKMLYFGDKCSAEQVRAAFVPEANDDIEGMLLKAYDHRT